MIGPRLAAAAQGNGGQGAAAHCEHQRKARQQVHDGIDDIDGGQGVRPYIGGNEHPVDDGVECSEQRGQVGGQNELQDSADAGSPPGKTVFHLHRTSLLCTG